MANAAVNNPNFFILILPERKMKTPGGSPF